jgi:hypothetical protein
LVRKKTARTPTEPRRRDFLQYGTVLNKGAFLRLSKP